MILFGFQLRELHLQCESVPVLGVLDEKDHQEGDDGCAGVDDKLPPVAVMKQRAGDAPKDHDGECQQKRGRPSSPGRRGIGHA